MLCTSINKIINIVIVFTIVFYIYFNRTPIRYVDYNKDIIVSPCDGVVTNSKDRYISIFLSPLDVHAQYAPIDSIIKSTREIHGKAHMANTPESDHNSGVEVVFNSKYGDIVVTQRVGFFVRRIQNHIDIGEYVERGYNYGKINFGSRVDIILPEGKTSILKPKQRVYGGLTIISIDNIKNTI